MFKIRKRCFGVVIALLMMVLMAPTAVHAQGTTTIHVSNGSPQVGDTISVDIVASASDNLSVKYNPEVLQLTGASEEYGTEGNTVSFQGTKATLQFKAAASGKSSIIVSGANVTGSSTSIQVGAGSSDSTEPKETGGNTTTASEGQFTVDGTAYVVSERFSDEEIPSGFDKIRVTIDGYAYKSLSNGEITLIYLKPAADTSGKGVFYIYDEQKNAVSTFAMIGNSENYILLTTPESMLIQGLQQKEVTVSGRTISAYVLGDSEEFYFVYGTNGQGTTGWYQYDTAEDTLQRVNEQLLSTTTTETENNQVSGDKDGYYEKWEKQRYLLAGLAFVIVVLLVLVINLFLSCRRAKEAMWDEEEFEEEDEEPVEVPEKNTRVSKRSEKVAEPDPIDENPTETKEEEKQPESFAYRDIKGTEAFWSNKETRYKSNVEDQLDIMDLNDL